MISFEEALATILDHAKPLGVERVPIERAYGCALAKPLMARFNSPAFDNSAVDGFAVRVADVAKAGHDAPVVLRLVETVRAGDVSRGAIRSGMAARVLTGAPLPLGTEAVVMQEVCEASADEVRVKRPVAMSESVRRAGEEFHKGDEVLPAGTRITPPVVGVLASYGHANVAVWKRPAASILCTGNELVPLGKPRPRGSIYDSNSYGLAAALTRLGLEPPRVERVPDEPRLTRQAMARALKASDLVLTVGGVSVGAYDFVKDVAGALGVQTVFWRVAIKPGKPLFFGVYPRARGRRPPTLVFGLPGNPVAALLGCHQFVKPALRRIMGLPDASPRTVSAILGADLSKPPGRMEWVRVTLGTEGEQTVARPVAGQGSHMLGGLAQAEGVVRFPAQATALKKGTPVRVEILSWDA